MLANDLPSAWRARAAELREWAAAEAAACALERAAAELQEALRSAEGALLTLDAAAAESGYSADHLRHLVADGTLPNAGQKGRPRIQRRDLPRRARAAATAGAYSPQEDARQLLSGATSPGRRQ